MMSRAKCFRAVLAAGWMCVLAPAGAAGLNVDVTFFFVADTHFGRDLSLVDSEWDNRAVVDDMNQLPGTAYPGGVGSAVDTPRGVLVGGDLTDNGTSSQWAGGSGWFTHHDGFIEQYGVNGQERLDYPVYEGYGNHDISGGSRVVKDGIIARNAERPGINVSSNGLHYSWDWDGLHFVNLNIYPGGSGGAENSLSFLKQDLAGQVGDSRRPVILYQHYGFGGGWWADAERQAYYNAIKDYNIAAIFKGHDHRTEHFVWNGVDVYGADTVQDRSYLVVHVTDGQLTVVQRNEGSWGSLWSQPVVFPTPPVAHAGGPYHVGIGSTVTLDAGASIDADQDIVSYAWDLNGDGVFETDAGVEPLFKIAGAYLLPLGYVSRIPGVPYEIRLRVTDDLGDRDVAAGWLTLYLPADANGDGLVNDDDLSILLANWTGVLGTGKMWDTGDLDGSGAVTDVDLSLLLANWTGPFGPDSAGAPEPITTTLLFAAAPALLRIRRKG